MSNEVTDQIERLPHVVGRYLLVERLGAGGMGAVYHALQLTRLTGVERFCVVKLALPRLAANRAIVSRFVHEARTSILLQHRNLCTTFDVDVDEDRILIAMESIAGRDLRAIMTQGHPGIPALSTAEAVALISDALDGLDYAHSFLDPRTGAPLQLVHRDISPHNLMVSWAGEVKVIDFGIALSELRAEVTGAGVVVGKVRYMAPEQTDGGVIDRRADVFCVGIVLAELLSGVRFWGQATDGEILSTLRGGAPLRSAAIGGIPAELRAVVERALAPHPRARFGSAGAFRDALKAAVPIEDTQATLRRALARLFPGGEAEQRAHVQDLYRRARATSHANHASWQDDAPTQRDLGLPAPAPASPRAPPAAALLADSPTRPTPLDDTVRQVRAPSPEAPTVPSSRPVEAPPAPIVPPTVEVVPVASWAASDATVRNAPARAAAPVPKAPHAGRGRAIAGAAAGAMLLAWAGVFAVATPRTDAASAGNEDANLASGGDASVGIYEAASPDAGAGTPRDSRAGAPPLDGGMTASAEPDGGFADARAGAPGDAGSAGAVDGEAMDDAGQSASRRDAKKRTSRVTRPARDLPPRPQRLGDRLRYLREHCATLACNERIQARATPIAEKSPDEIRTLNEDVAQCLDACGAR